MLAHSLRCWPSIKPALVQRLVFAGAAFNITLVCLLWRRVQADTDPMFFKCWASVAGAGQYPFSPSQYFMLADPACWWYRHNALNQSWVNVGPSSVTLAHIQHGANSARALGLNLE